MREGAGQDASGSAEQVADGADPGPVTAARLAELDRRVAALEAERRGTAPAVGERGGDAGSVGYRGDVTLAGHVVWSIDLAADAVLALPDTGGLAVLAGLGHPARAAMVRRLITGPAGVAELQDAVGSTSTGQLYHHLRTLTACGLVIADGRGNYRVPTTAVVPALTLLLAAADVAGLLGTAPGVADTAAE